MHRSRVHPAFLIAVIIAGCVSPSRPASCDAGQTAIELSVTAAAMEPDDPAACRGQRVILLVSSSVDGVLHIHGLDALVPATSITAGEELRLEFDATTSGQFPIELHTAGDSQGATIGILTVHER
jgi:hypothetical protein